MNQFLLILLALFLVWLNGFFVAAEFGLVKLRNTRVQAIKKIYSHRGQVLEKLHSQLDTYLSACQLGITLASLGLGWIGEPAFADLIEPGLRKLGIFSHTTVTAIAFFSAFFIISFLHIVAGELAPKSLAIRRPEKISLWTALPLYYFYWMMYPFIWLLNHSANLILHSLGKAAASEIAHYSADELKIILHSSHSLGGELEKEELEILDNVLDFAELKVGDIMRPFDDLVVINLNKPVDEILETIGRYRFSRYPVYDKDPEIIMGVLHVKDMFFSSLSKSNKSLKELVRPIYSTHTDLPAIDLFRQFRAGLTHFAIVKHSSGAVVGFVTLDNILNTLLGQIRDEFNMPTPNLMRTKDGSILMKGNAPLYLLEKELDFEFPPMDAHTISGLLLEKLERMPRDKESLSFENFDLTVLKVKGPKVLLVKIFPKKTL